MQEVYCILKLSLRSKLERQRTAPENSNLFIWLFTYLFSFLYIYLFIYSFIYLLSYLFSYSFISLSIYLVKLDKKDSHAYWLIIIKVNYPILQKKQEKKKKKKGKTGHKLNYTKPI